MNFPYRVPVNWCNQAIDLILETNQRNSHGDIELAPPQHIDNVIAQMETIFSGTDSNRMKVASGVFFIYRDISTPFPTLDTTTHGQIVYEGKVYAISDISVNKVPISNAIWSYEIEVNNVDDTH